MVARPALAFTVTVTVEVAARAAGWLAVPRTTEASSTQPTSSARRVPRGVICAASTPAPSGRNDRTGRVAGCPAQRGARSRNIHARSGVAMILTMAADWAHMLGRGSLVDDSCRENCEKAPQNH